MAMTMTDVRRWLDAEEVDYQSAKKLGVPAIPFLLELVQGGDLGLAAKAAYLASLIKGEKAAAVLKAAVARNEPTLRVAVAAGIRNLSEVHADKVAGLLQDDSDMGVRKVVLRSAAGFRSPAVTARVKRMAEADPESFVRELAESTMRSMGKSSMTKKSMTKKSMTKKPTTKKSMPTKSATKRKK